MSFPFSSAHNRIAPETTGRGALQITSALLVIAVASAAGPLALASLDGLRASQSTASALLPPLGAWVLLAAWALLFALLLSRMQSIPAGRALAWAAAPHALLLPLLLLAFAASTPQFAAWYQGSGWSDKVMPGLAASYLLGVPLAGQMAILVVCGRRWLLARLPLLAILAVALVLRASHLGWGLPGLLHPDEHRYLGPAIIMAARGDMNPHYFENPSLMIYLAFLLFRGLTPQSIAFHTLDEVLLLGIPDPRGDYLQMVALRGVSVLAGVLTVLMVYLAGKELFGKRAGLLGACLLTVSFLHVRNSHYATNDVLAVFFLSASFYYAVRVYGDGRWQDYLMAGIAGGLGVSTKYNAGVFVFAIVAAHLMRTMSDRKLRFSPVAHLPLVAAGLFSLASFVAGTPYSVLDQRGFLEGFLDQVSYGAQGWAGQVVEPSYRLFLAALGQGFGVLPLLLGVAGFLVAVRESRFKGTLLLATPVAYYVFMSTQQLFFARFALPLLPFLSVAAGLALDRAMAAMPRGRPAAGLGAVLIILAVAQPLWLSVQHDRLVGNEDTRLAASTWMAQNLPRTARVSMEGYAQPDPKFGWRGFEAEEVRIHWPDTQDFEKEVLGWGADYVVVSNFGYGSLQANGPADGLPAPYDLLEERGELVALIAPGRGNRELPYSLDDMYTPFWRLDERERPGPTVRIYRMLGPIAPVASSARAGNP